MKINLEVSDAAIVSNLQNAFRHEWFLEAESLPSGDSGLRPFRVEALDPKTDKPRWYDVSLKDIERGVCMFIARPDGDRLVTTGGYSNDVSDLLMGALDEAAADLLLQFMVWGLEVYA